MRQIVLLILTVIGCALVGNLLMAVIFSLGGVDIQAIMGGAELPQDHRMVFRFGLLLNHFFMFLVPSLIYLCKFSSFDTLRDTSQAPLSTIFFWGLVMLVSYPFISQLAIWNAALPIPEALTQPQEDSFALLRNTLRMDHPIELLLSVLLVGVAAGVGEELLFRGVLQNLFEKMWGNPHAAIIMAALIFGGFHMQFERVLPLAFLGLILGYSYYYTRNIWVPIILHFANNTFQVLSIYAVTSAGEELPEMDALPDISPIAVIISILLSLGAAYLAITRTSVEYESRP